METDKFVTYLEDHGMDAETIMQIRPALTQFLHRFDGCFGRITARRHLDTYIEGQLGPLERKSVEPIADAAGVPPRTLQQFLSLYRWDESTLRDRLQQHVARRHAHPHSVGVIDETSFVKKGKKTAGVQRQHCGAVGKKENCVVSVHLGYATPDFHTMLDGELYLPQKTWHEQRERCREAGIPDDVVYRSKHQIALEQYQRALGNGLRFAWLTFDEFYGRNRRFLRVLDLRGQNYVAEVPSNFTVWTSEPQVLYRDHARDKKPGRPRRYPRLKVKNNPRIEVRNVLTYSPVMRKASWETYHVKEGSKGPMVWEAKRILVWLPDENGLPTHPHLLMVARNVLNYREIKYFISNAPSETKVETLLKVAFSRWTIERVFEDSKGELGMNHFEVRKYPSIRRHLILSCVSHLFLSEFCLKHRGEKSRPDHMPGAQSHGHPGTALVSGWPLFIQTG
jgi:SRSO17 transposase